METAVATYASCLEDAREMLANGYTIIEVEAQLKHDEVNKSWIGSIVAILKQERGQATVSKKRK